jgi:hypothetical protein
MNQTPQQVIEEAISKLNAMKKAVGVDPKWMNRTLSHLDNAWSTAHHIVRAGSLADTPEASSASSESCTCPFAGTVDSACPIHGRK